MALYREQGIVLRTYKLGEADRIVSLLTPGRGKVRGVAKGVRKTSSRLGGRLEPYSHVDLQMYEGRTLDVVTQAQLINSFAAIRQDYDLSTCAAGIAEAADRIAQEDEQATRVFVLVLDAFRRLAVVPAEPAMVLDAFVLRVASVAGYHPVVQACAVCGRSYDPATATTGSIGFHIAAGGLLCSACRPADAQRISPGTIALLAGWSLDADWGQSGSQSADRRDRRVATALVHSFFTYHIGRPLRAWDLVAR